MTVENRYDTTNRGNDIFSFYENVRKRKIMPSTIRACEDWIQNFGVEIRDGKGNILYRKAVIYPEKEIILFESGDLYRQMAYVFGIARSISEILEEMLKTEVTLQEDITLFRNILERPTDEEDGYFLKVGREVEQSSKK